MYARRVCLSIINNAADLIPLLYSGKILPLFIPPPTPGGGGGGGGVLYRNRPVRLLTACQGHNL